MPEPKYRQIANELRAAISAGDYAPGDRLPGENDLMAQHGVARMTARQALGVLTTEGVAESRKGSGVYVRDFTPIIREALTRLSHERWARGASIWSADAEGRDLEVDTTVTDGNAPRRIAELLALEHDTRVWIRSRRFVLDGKPVLLSTSYLPVSVVGLDSPIARENTGPGGSYARLAELGYAPAHFREDIRARMPQPGETKALDLPSAGTPVVDIVRTAFTDAGLPVEVNEMTLDASAYILRYDFSA
jgi:GntR family transcriptional regulator